MKIYNVLYKMQYINCILGRQKRYNVVPVMQVGSKRGEKQDQYRCRVFIILLRNPFEQFCKHLFTAKLQT